MNAFLRFLLAVAFLTGVAFGALLWLLGTPG